MSRITLPQLKPIFADYADWLKDWQAVERDKLVRTAGPVAQGLWLDRLRTREYRPTFYIRVLTIPRTHKGGMDDVQDLSIRLRQLCPGRHPDLFPRIKQEAETEVRPPITKPLEPDEVYSHLKEKATNPTQVVTLSSFALYLGKWDDYYDCKKRYIYLRNTEYKSASQSLVCQQNKFLEDAEESIKRSTTSEFLDGVIAQQKELEGIKSV